MPDARRIVTTFVTHCRMAVALPQLANHSAPTQPLRPKIKRPNRMSKMARPDLQPPFKAPANAHSMPHYLAAPEQRPLLRGVLETLDTQRIAGWCINLAGLGAPVELELSCEGLIVARFKTSITRPDLAAVVGQAVDAAFDFAWHYLEPQAVDALLACLQPIEAPERPAAIQVLVAGRPLCLSDNYLREIGARPPTVGQMRELLESLRAAREQPISPPLVITGMHRSGTSTVAGLFRDLNVWFGEEHELLRADEWNPRGYCEHLSLIALNDQILANSGYAWDAVPPQGLPAPAIERQFGLLRSKAELLSGALSLRAQTANLPRWGLKDPRLLVTWGFWKQVLPEAQMLILLRNPVEIARSLASRHGLSIQFGLRLSERYLAALEGVLTERGSRARLLSLRQLGADPEQALERLTSWTKLPTGPSITAPLALKLRESGAREGRPAQQWPPGFRKLREKYESLEKMAQPT